MPRIDLGQDYALEKRGTSIRLHHKLNDNENDMIQFDFTNQADPDNSSFQFIYSYDDDNHISNGTFMSEFSDYQMVVTIYEDEDSARVELTTSRTPLSIYHVPVAVADQLIQYGKNSQVQDGGKRKRTHRKQTKRRRTMKRKN
jgi:hypothetical protein